ncbi:consortin, connexin sorting protein b [Hippoglossus stenolepis]|uniref:consortin, connexin sorting protein b n=1 Tax=Hippoglossus stenolepis TaxID=195615 RepID=UPI001FAF0134|nr:consortin, connexin sorting protein b [Hippoglossus stenolepis]XP_034999762.2 consortin, connexin sorting protein b [Hippoglossus stenolepis]
MGNKNSSLPKGSHTALDQEEEEMFIESTTGSVSRDGALGLSPELLASLQSLGENSNYTLLPHSLHQIAEAYSLQEDYQWAIQFLQLEKLYHERLLSNLAALQENWESRWRERNPESSLPAVTDAISVKHIETLSQICRTHPRPSSSVEQNSLNTLLREIQIKNQTLQSCHDRVNNPQTSQEDGEHEQNVNSGSVPSSPETGREEGGGEEDGEEEKEIYEEGQDVEEEEENPCAETPEEEEEVKVEWPTGVSQASDKDLAKLSHTEGSSSPDGLVSILKRRRASLDGLPPPSDIATKQNSKRKVRFSEPEDGTEQDEVGGDSCLILLLLCLVTVVISVGGTALYCTLVDTYSNICTDFTQNVNFYILNVRRFFEGLGHWLPLRT